MFKSYFCFLNQFFEFYMFRAYYEYSKNSCPILFAQFNFSFLFDCSVSFFFFNLRIALARFWLPKEVRENIYVGQAWFKQTKLTFVSSLHLRIRKDYCRKLKSFVKQSKIYLKHFCLSLKVNKLLGWLINVMYVHLCRFMSKQRQRWYLFISCRFSFYNRIFYFSTRIYVLNTPLTLLLKIKIRNNSSISLEFFYHSLPNKIFVNFHI